MKNVTLISLFLLSFSALSLEATLKSRSIMNNCMFVTQVASDIVVTYKNDQQNLENIYLKGRFKNTWDSGPQWSNMLVIAGALSEVEDSKVFSWTQHTMNSPKRFLFRQFYFQFYKNERPVSEVFTADVGREFGEDCQTNRKNNPPYFARPVTVVQ